MKKLKKKKHLQAEIRRLKGIIVNIYAELGYEELEIKRATTVLNPVNLSKIDICYHNNMLSVTHNGERITKKSELPIISLLPGFANFGLEMAISSLINPMMQEKKERL